MTANTFVGEGTGLIDDIRPAGDLLKRMVGEAAVPCSNGGWRR